MPTVEALAHRPLQAGHYLLFPVSVGMDDIVATGAVLFQGVSRRLERRMRLLNSIDCGQCRQLWCFVFHDHRTSLTVFWPFESEGRIEIDVPGRPAHRPPRHTGTTYSSQSAYAC